MPFRTVSTSRWTNQERCLVYAVQHAQIFPRPLLPPLPTSTTTYIITAHATPRTNQDTSLAGSTEPTHRPLSRTGPGKVLPPIHLRERGHLYLVASGIGYSHHEGHHCDYDRVGLRGDGRSRTHFGIAVSCIAHHVSCDSYWLRPA